MTVANVTAEMAVQILEDHAAGLSIRQLAAKYQRSTWGILRVVNPGLPSFTGQKSVKPTSPDDDDGNVTVRPPEPGVSHAPRGAFRALAEAQDRQDRLNAPPARLSDAVARAWQEAAWSWERSRSRGEGSELDKYRPYAPLGAERPLGSWLSVERGDHYDRGPRGWDAFGRAWNSYAK
jgi:hypothetical protein